MPIPGSTHTLFCQLLLVAVVIAASSLTAASYSASIASTSLSSDRERLRASEWKDELKLPAIGCVLPTAGRALTLRRVAVMYDKSISGFNTSLTDDLANLLARSGRFAAVDRLSAEQLATHSSFNVHLIDTLMVVQAPLLPIWKTNFTANYLEFLQHGGQLVLLGGRPPLFHTPKIEQIGVNVMDDYEPYWLENVTIKSANSSLAHFLCQDQKLNLYDSGKFCSRDDLSIPGQFSGLSAMAWAFPGEMVFSPLLSAYDQFGRWRGFGGSAAQHAHGAFAGGTWWLFGIRESDFYETDAFKQLLMHCIEGQLSVVWDGRCKNEPQLTANLRNYPTRSKQLPTLSSLFQQEGFLRLSDDHKHIVYPNKRPFFLIGADFYRSIRGDFDPQVIATDFEKAANYGLTSFRMFGYDLALEQQPDVLEVVRHKAHQHGLYMLMDLSCKPEKDKEQNTSDGVRASAKRIAALLQNETWLLGYDLCNEPYYWDLGAIFLNSTTQLHDVFPFNKRSPSMADFLDYLNPGYSSTFPNLAHGLGDIPARFQPVLGDVSGIYKTWLQWRIDSIRSVEQHSLLTVGYNTIYGLLSLNSVLDIVSHHAYPNAPGYQFTLQNYSQSMAVPTTMDRLAAVWNPQLQNVNMSKHMPPNFQIRPITYGEYGASNGDTLEMSDGTKKYLDFQTAALYDLIIWLRMLSEGYDGAMRWRLNDKPYVMALRQQQWLGNDSNPTIHEAYIRETRFGLFWYDGTDHGQPKPLAFCLRFLSQYLASLPATLTTLKRGILKTWPVSSGVHVAYSYTANDAFFIGSTNSSDEQLMFTPLTSSCSNVMLFWRLQGDRTEEQTGPVIYLMTSADANITLQPDKFVPSLHAQSVKVTGDYAKLERSGNQLLIVALAGEVVTFSQ